ncbi:MAG: APC family permease [Pseudomonadales bacterium]
MYSSGKPFGFWSAVLLGVGAMVGAGIFALMGQAGSVAGAAVWQSFLYGGLVAALSGYSFGRLGARYPSAGGLVEYLVRGYGDSYFAGSAAVLLYVSGLLALALIAKAFGSYASALVLGETSRWVVDGFALAVVGLLTWINLNGPGEVSRIENAFVVSKVLVLVSFVAIGLAYVQPDRLAPSEYPDQLHVAASIGFTFFAFEGFRVITNTAEDMPHPAVQLPRAMLTAIALVAVLYVLMSVVVFGNLDVPQVIAARDYALAQAAEPVFGTTGFVVVGIVAMISTASAINANLYAVTNVTYQMARYGELPQAFRRPIAHSREGLLISAGTVAAMVPSFDLTSLAVAGSVTILLVHIAVHAGHWRLTRETGAARPLIGLALVANAGVVLAVVGFQLAHHPRSLLYLGGFVLLAVLLETVLRRVTGRELRSRPRWGHRRSGRSPVPADNEVLQGAGEDGHD